MYYFDKSRTKNYIICSVFYWPLTWKAKVTKNLTFSKIYDKKRKTYYYNTNMLTHNLLENDVQNNNLCTILISLAQKLYNIFSILLAPDMKSESKNFTFA